MQAPQLGPAPWALIPLRPWGSRSACGKLQQVVQEPTPLAVTLLHCLVRPMPWDESVDRILLVCGLNAVIVVKSMQSR